MVWLNRRVMSPRCSLRTGCRVASKQKLSGRAAHGGDSTSPAQVSTLRGTLVLQVANFGDTRQTAKIAISGFAISPSAKVTQISGKLDDVNTAERSPNESSPKKNRPSSQIRAKIFCTSFPPRSFTVIRWEGTRENLEQRTDKQIE